MASKTGELNKKGLLQTPPKFLESAVQYEVLMGSMAYGVANESSDMDVYGFAIPPRDYVFPHLRGEIPGFDKPGARFEQFQQHHITDPGARGGKAQEYDITIFSIIKYFALLTDNNPNIIDSLFVPRNCVLHTSAIGELVRERRHIFLHKGAWHKFKGYAYSQMHKMRAKDPTGKRKASVEQFGYDVKYAYHIVRLLNEVEQILLEGDLVLDRNREQLKEIRRGEWSLERVERYFADKERDLESVYLKSELRYGPDRAAIKSLLLECLQMHYGSLHECLYEPGASDRAVLEIERIIAGIRR